MYLDDYMQNKFKSINAAMPILPHPVPTKGPHETSDNTHIFKTLHHKTNKVTKVTKN